MVATDGSGDFKTIREAVAAAPDSSDERTVIHIKPGTYTGPLMVPKAKAKISFEGDDAATTILSYDRNINEQPPDNWPVKYKGIGVVVLGDDFHASKVTFTNVSGDHGQALALRLDGDRGVLENCRLIGWQDTLRLDDGRDYLKDCYIAGRVDFIYGSATAVFDHCEIHSRNGGFVTAANTPQDKPFGFVFMNCKLTGDAIAWDPASTNPATTQKARVTPMADLGRP
ncbi:MAG TPA: pectinesterase family protein, partial [Tepidisphaeraceae bacterium]|nr:pectinesterase family protein [Tepidisphaeraceae bacterium]